MVLSADNNREFIIERVVVITSYSDKPVYCFKTTGSALNRQAFRGEIITDFRY